MIVPIKTENEIKNVLHNTVRELPLTVEEITLKLWNDDFILKMKDQIIGKVKNRKVNESNAFSIYDGVLMYADRIVIPTSLQKRMLKEFLEWNPWWDATYTGQKWMKTSKTWLDHA